MKWSITLTEDNAQFNLQAETPHEEELCKIFSSFNGGSVGVHQGAHIGMNQGGFMRSWDDGVKVCAITLSKQVDSSIGA